MTAIDSFGLKVDRSLLVPVFLLLLLTIVTGALSRPLVQVPWHPPDAHSSLPHRAADAGLSANPAVAGVLVPLGVGERRGWVSAEPSRLPERVAADAPDHPPR